MSLIAASQLAKTYRVGDVDVPALRGLDFTIEPGAFVTFVGPSGSGENTRCDVIGRLDNPTSRKLTIRDGDVAFWKEKAP